MRSVSLLLGIALISCNESDLNQANLGRAAVIDIERDSDAATGSEDADGSANEPVMIGGGFLWCQPQASVDDQDYLANCRIEKDNEKLSVPSHYQVSFHAKDQVGELTALDSNEVESDDWQWEVRVPRSLDFVALMASLIHDSLVEHEFEFAILPESFATSFELVCRDSSSLDSFPQEFGSLCENGQASSVFQAALTSAYTGVGEVPVTILDSTFQNGTSHILGVSAIIIPAPIAQVMERAELINTMNFTAADVRYNYSTLSQGEVEGPKHLANYLVRVDFRFPTGNQDVTLTVQRDFFSLRSDHSLINLRSFTLNSQVNSGVTDVDTSNGLYYLIGEGDQTIVVAVYRRLLSHQTQHRTVEDIFLALNRRLLTEFYQLLGGL